MIPTPPSESLRDRAGERLFLACAAAHTGLLAAFGQAPSSHRLDINNYLELALNLWREGIYGSHVSTDYPPLYPMLLAPVFAIDSNALRFAVIYATHGVLLALACAALFPLLRGALGTRTAWRCLAASQFLAGATYHAWSARTELLFTVEICFAVAALWWAFERPSGRRWALVGLVCGLAIATRRAALVLLPAAALVIVVEALLEAGGVRAAARRILGRGALVGAGLALGLVPEGIASMIHGGTIQTYHEGVMGSHLSPLTRMWASPARLWLAVQTWARQPLYGVLAFVGSPLVIAALLLRRKPPGPRAPVPLAAASGFVLLVTLGLAAMSALHILRYAYGRPGAEAFHLYPRYMDPVEPAAVLVAVALAGWHHRHVRGREQTEALRTALLPWLVPVALIAWVSGYAWRFRGGRLPPQYWFDGLLWHAYPTLFMGATLVMLLGLMAWWSRGRYGTARTVVLAVCVGWLLSPHALTKPKRWTHRVPRTLSILKVEVLERAPRAPLAVPVPLRPTQPRGLYAPAFRSDHPVYWPPASELGEWLAEHPDGFVLTRRWEREPGPRLELELVGFSRTWRLWAPRGREEAAPDLMDRLRAYDAAIRAEEEEEDAGDDDARE